MGILIKILVNAVAIWVAAALIDGVEVNADTTSSKLLTFLLVGAIFGVVNAIIKPVVTLLALPLYVLSLGLFAFIVNALMLELVSWIAGQLDIPFHVGDFFWDAVLAAIVVSLVSWVLNLAIRD